MSLSKQGIPITFDAVDTKTAEQLLAPGKFISLANCVRRKTGKIEKRYGTETLGNAVLGGTFPINGRLIDHHNNDLLVLDSKYAYSYSPANDALINRGRISSATVASSQVVRNPSRQAMSDAAHADGKTLYVWQDSRATNPAEAIRYSLYDDATGSALVSDVELSADGLSPRVVPLASKFAVFYIEATTIKVRFVEYATPTTISAETSVDTVSSGTLFDAVSYDGTLALLAYLTAADNYKIAYMLPSGAIGNGANGASAAISRTVASNITALSLSANAETYTVFFVYAHATKVILDGYYRNLLNRQSVDIETIATIRNITSVPTTGGTAAVYYEQGTPATVAAAKNQTVRTATVNYTLSASTVTSAAAYFKGSVGLGAKAFYDGTNTFAVLTYESALQSSFYVCRDDGFLMARVAAGLGGGLTREAQPATIPNPSTLQSGLPSVFVDIEGRYAFPTTIRAKFQATLDGTVYSAAQGLQKSAVALDNLEYNAKTLNGTYHLAGGILYAYGGDAPVEHGFLVYPEDVTAAVFSQTFAPADVNTGTEVITLTGHTLVNDDIIRFSNSGGALPAIINTTTSYYVISAATNSIQVSATLGGTALIFAGQGTGTHTVYKYGGTHVAGTYYYGVIYEWVDAQGNTHRSAPAYTYATSTIDGQLITITYPNLRLTLKDGTTRANVKAVLYRGLESGDSEVLYRLTDANNSVTTASSTFLDTGSALISAADLALQEVLYTTGGVIDNTAAPSSTCITGHRNRLFLGGLEDGNTIAYSKYAVPGEGVAFSDLFTMRCDPRGGNIQALYPLDDKLVIFKKDAIFTLVGDGPLDTGAQNDYTEPQLISSDVGCAYPRSIALTPNGLMFKSDKGIYLLDRNLTATYIGAPVEVYNSSTVTSAVVMEDQNEVRFTTSDNICLVFNYYYGLWSWFTNYGAESATGGSAGYYLLSSEGEIRTEVAGLYNDSGATYSMEIETGWISLGGVQGYQRLYQIMGLGDFYSDHYTKIKTAYDFEAAYTETVYFNVANGLILEYYGDDPTYGSSSPYGGSGSSVYQWSLQPRRQKCQSIKLLISDVDTKTEAGGASFSFVSLNIVAGIKPNGPKLGYGKQIGSL